MDREKTIFKYALFCFATTLCAIDHMNHTDGIEVNDEERGMPSSFELMNLESGDELVNPRYGHTCERVPFPTWCSNRLFEEAW